MVSVDWDELAKKLTAIKSNTVSSRSRAVYQNSFGRFIAWVIVNKPDLQLRKQLKSLLDLDASNPPLKFDALQVNIFGARLLTLEKADGGSLSFSALNTHRAGLFNLCRDYGHDMPPVLEKEMRLYFKGLKREMASAAARGEARAKTGKDPLSFELYQFLCERLLRCSSKDLTFARTYMIVAWDLMCRSANAFGIRHAHMEWSGDALCVYFAHQKNDQDGSRPRDPRHIYANPLRPAICPVLALAVFWATSSFDGDDHLFPGSNQYERFRKCLQRLLETNDVAIELRRRGVNQDELGTHSMRKGAATYCTSGSTACPSSTSVHLRAGRSLGVVQNTYLRYEAAGDMHVGRTVAGLPPDSHEFFALGFKSPDIPVPTISAFELTIRPIEQSGDRLQATGVPPHVSILSKLKALLDTNLKTIERIDATRTATVKEIMCELEKRAIGAGTVTFDGLDDTLKHCLDAVGATELVNRLNDGVAGASAPENDAEQPLTTPFFCRFRRVPADFKFPECSGASLWVMWQCGNASKKVPALKLLDGRDMPTRNLQKRLSDVRYLMGIIESAAKRTGLWSMHQSVEEAVKVFNACADSVEVPNLTATSRKRRQGQLSWTTVVALHRKRSRMSVS